MTSRRAACSCAEFWSADGEGGNKSFHQTACDGLRAVSLSPQSGAVGRRDRDFDVVKPVRDSFASHVSL